MRLSESITSIAQLTYDIVAISL